MENEMRRWAIGIGVAMVGGLVGASSEDVRFRDREGNMEITGLSSWRAKQLDDGSLSFTGTGSPFLGKWRDQGLTIRGQKIEGKAARSDKGLKLSQATVSGGVRTEWVSERSGQTRTHQLNCNSATYDLAQQRLSLQGGVTWTTTSANSPRLMRLTGTSATVIFQTGAGTPSNSIESGTLVGPIQIRIETEREVRADSGKTEVRKVTLTGRAGRATYSDSSRTLVLTGSIFLEGDDTVLGGTVDAAKATLRFSPQGELVEVDLEGSPGRTTLLPTPSSAGGTQ